MSVVVFVGVDGAVVDSFAHDSASEPVRVLAEERIDRVLAARASELDVVVVGASVPDPIQATQRVFRLDPAISVVILGDSEQCKRITAALRFTPFIGSDIECTDSTPASATPCVARAVERTQARRRHRLSVRLMNTQLAQESAPSGPRGEELVAQLVDLAPIGIVSLDVKERILSVNPEASRLLQVTERECLGQSIADVPLGDLPWGELLASTRTATATAIAHATRDGQLRSLEVRAARLAGASAGFLLVVQDVTDRERLTQARQEAVERMELASRLKDEFLAMVSHELRTPLNAIVGWTRLARSGRLGPEKLAHALETIDRNAHAQTLLVEDLLDVSRVINGQLHVELGPVRLDEVLDEAVQSIFPTARAKNIAITVARDHDVPLVAGDAARLRQVVWNLLSNGVKFAPVGGMVTAEIRRSNAGVTLRIADDGPGIPELVLPYIFDAFRQAVGGTTRAHGGLGLGLAIARRLVELHGGTVEATNRAEGGAALTVHLPALAHAEQVATKVGPLERPPFSNDAPPAADMLRDRRILVLEDDDDSRELLCTFLQDAGAVILAARSVDEAEAVLARHEVEPLHLVISDIGMPGRDGYDFIETFRAREDEHHRVPAIALTAYTRTEDRSRALLKGFDAHAAKPIDPAALLALAVKLAPA